MSEVSTEMRDDIERTLLDVAMVIDSTQHATAEHRVSREFHEAAAIVRHGRRKQIELTSDLETVIRFLKEMDIKLAIIGGCASDAIAEARQLIGDLRERLSVEA